MAMSQELIGSGHAVEPVPPMAGDSPAFVRDPAWLRAFEITVAVSVLVVAAPLLVVIAVLIRRGTPGQALFRQQRLAVGARPFTFCKFRTHYVDAKERFPQWCAYQYSEDELAEVRLQVEDDPRVTPQGRWLRRTSLDELPNFWHVITGDMALVGPRPEMAEMLPYYHAEQLAKFSVRPGITGLAQVSGRGSLTFAETVDLDLRYVRTRSLSTDLRILLRTFLMVIRADGAM
jgi:lipopolysaccharide/colanic/teichoic acid biosynthesis glycosyltransferase